MTHTTMYLHGHLPVDKEEAKTYCAVPSSNKKVDASLAGPPDPGGTGKGNSL